MDSTSSKTLGQKRPALHRLIDELPEAELEVVERILARLEMERLWSEVCDGFTNDWSDGKYNNLDVIIREVRADLELRAA